MPTEQEKPPNCAECLCELTPPGTVRGTRHPELLACPQRLKVRVTERKQRREPPPPPPPPQAARPQNLRSLPLTGPAPPGRQRMLAATAHAQTTRDWEAGVPSPVLVVRRPPSSQAAPPRHTGTPRTSPAQDETAREGESSSVCNNRSPWNPRAHREERSCRARRARAKQAPPGPQGNTLLVGKGNTACQRAHRVPKTLLIPKDKDSWPLEPGDTALAT